MSNNKGAIEGDVDYFYMLDWDKLHQIMKDKVLQEKDLRTGQKRLFPTRIEPIENAFYKK